MKLKNCNFCGACAIQHTHPDVNYKGESGYKSTVNCSKCIKHIEKMAIAIPPALDGGIRLPKV